MTFDELTDAVAAGSLDTVLVCFVDMQGRLMGKRMHAAHFAEGGWQEAHCCNYLLATDLEMTTPEGFAATSWESGYGDYVLRPDLTTLRPAPWQPGTALVLCDVLDPATGAEVAHSPRAMLKSQIARLAALGLQAETATELEFFLFEKSYDALRRAGYRRLEPLAGYNGDYNIFLTSREEPVMRPVRNHLRAAGIPIEASKGEAEAGQEELNIRHAPALLTADHHAIAKHVIKEVAYAQGHAASFLAKWAPDRVGSSAHLHQSLWRDGAPAFLDPADPLGMSGLMKSWVAGQLRHAAEITLFLAPYVNSYKRFARGSFAPTRILWSVDNRTAGFRLCGAGTKAVRIECRIGGSDLNPYLASAVLLAAGIAGIEAGLELEPPAEGNGYRGSGGVIPTGLGAARRAALGSDMLRAAFGDAVIEHYARAAEVELDAFAAAVTDWEIARGFERA